MEAATKLSHIAGGELDVRDEDIAARSPRSPYNDCLGVNTYKCQFLRAASRAKSRHSTNGTKYKGSSRWFLKGVGESCAKAYPPPIGTGSAFHPEGLYDLLHKNDYPTTRRSTSPRTAWAIRTTSRMALSTTPLASTICASISHGIPAAIDGGVNARRLLRVVAAGPVLLDQRL